MNSRLGRILVAGLAAAALSATALQAQTRASIGLGAGLTTPTGNFNNGFKSGWIGQVTAHFALVNLPVEIRVDGTYGENKSDFTNSIKAKLFGGMVGAQLPVGTPGSPVRPYLLGGVGVTNFKIDGGTSGSASQTKFTWQGGAGLSLSAGTARLFVEARYVSVNLSGGSANYFPIVAGIRLGGK